LQVDLALDRPLRALFRHDGVAHLIESMIPAGEVQFELHPLVDIDWGREEGGCWLRAAGRGKFGGSSDFSDRSRPSQHLRHRMQTPGICYSLHLAGCITESSHSRVSRVHVMNRTWQQARRSFRWEGWVTCGGSRAGTRSWEGCSRRMSASPLACRAAQGN